MIDLTELVKGVMATDAKERYKLIGRVTTTTYKTAKGFAQTKRFDILKRQSTLALSDVIDDIEFGIPLNLLDVPDGVYELTACNFSRDWETGIIDDWDVTLLPITDYPGNNTIFIRQRH